jgi:GH35 family endo-1,4-beta-xylanase
MLLQVVWSTYHCGEKQNKVITRPTAKDVSDTKKHRQSYWTNPSFWGMLQLHCWPRNNYLRKVSSADHPFYVDHKTSSKLVRPLDP